MSIHRPQFGPSRYFSHYLQYAVLMMVLAACGDVMERHGEGRFFDTIDVSDVADGEGNLSETQRDINMIANEVLNQIYEEGYSCSLAEDTEKVVNSLIKLANGDNPDWTTANCPDSDQAICEESCFENVQTGEKLHCQSSVDAEEDGINSMTCSLSIPGRDDYVKVILSYTTEEVQCEDWNQFSIYLPGSSFSISDGWIGNMNDGRYSECENDLSKVIYSFSNLFPNTNVCLSELPVNDSCPEDLCPDGREKNEGMQFPPEYEYELPANACYSSDINTQYDTFDSPRYVKVVYHRSVEPLGECHLLRGFPNAVADYESLDDPQIVAHIAELNRAYADLNVTFVATELNVSVKKLDTATFQGCEVPKSFRHDALNIYLHTTKPYEGDGGAMTFGTPGYYKGVMSSTSLSPLVTVHESGHLAGLTMELDENCKPQDGFANCDIPVNEDSCDQAISGYSDGVCDTSPYPGFYDENANPNGCIMDANTCESTCGVDGEGVAYQLHLNYMYTAVPMPENCLDQIHFTPGQLDVINCTLHTDPQWQGMLMTEPPEVAVVHHDIRALCDDYCASGGECPWLAE